jgi:hypothetical protein
VALPTKKPLAWAGAGARPRVLGGYHVLDEIGRNAVGPLYLARLEGPNGFQRWAAIRKVDKRHTAEPGYVQDFHELVRAGAKLLHPNVAALFDVGEEDGAPWVAMEYLHGERIEEAIERLEIADTPASWEIAARIIADAAEGLYAVHSLRDKEGAPLGLLHGDLAPHSLAVTYEGKTKIKGAFEPRKHGVLDPRKVPYAAPEQLFDGVVDARADVFALGVLLWELLAGKRLFARGSDDETRAMIEAGVVPPLGDVVQEVPTELDVLVRRALARAPAQRFASARDLSRELEGLLVSKGVVARDDDVGRYMRTLFADRYDEQEARLQAAADVTEIFRRSQKALGARPLAALPDRGPTAGALPDVSAKDAESEETELMRAPLEPDDDHTTAERPIPVPAAGSAPRPVSGFTDEVLADSGPTQPRANKPVLSDTDEIPTITAPQDIVVARPSSKRMFSDDELTLTAAKPEAPVGPGASTSRLIMPSSLESDPDVTESAIFVAPRIPVPTPPEMDRSPPPVPPTRPLLPSFPDRPLLPPTPETGVTAIERPIPIVRQLPPTVPPFEPPAAFPPRPSSRGPHSALSTAALRALFPQDRSKRVVVVSIAGSAGGVLLFLIFFGLWRLTSGEGSTASTASTALPSVTTPTVGAPGPASGAMTTPPPSAAPTTTAPPAPPPSATASSAPAPTTTVPSIPTIDLSQPSPKHATVVHHHHHHAVVPHAAPRETAAAPVSTRTGYLTVMCRPVACDHVIDAGHDLGGSPLFRHEVSTGKHVLTLRVDSTHTQRVVTVEVPEGQNVAIHPDVSP